MKLKTDDKGTVVVQDGKPVYLADDGREIAFDYPATLATISRLNGEAKSHRERAEAAEGKLKGFDGIEDPDKARAALTTVKNLDSHKLIDAGKVDELKAEMKRAFDDQLRAADEKIKPVTKERDQLRSQLHKEIIGGSFGRSKFIGDKLAIPADLAQARFGEFFTVDDGKLVAKDAAGNKIFSPSKPGELADFDEAMEILVGQYPYRDSILKGTGASGSGATGTSAGADGKKTIKRSAFEGMAAPDQMKAMKEGSKIVD